MRNLCLSAIAGALLLSAGCSSHPSAAALESEAAPTAVILLGEVDLPKGATLDDFPSLLNAGGIPWEKVQEGRVQLEGSFDRPWSDGRSLAVAVDVLGRTTFGAIFAGCVLTLAFGAVVMALNISSAEDAALYAATLLSAGLGYWVGR